MPLEVDVAAHQILKRHQLSVSRVHHKLAVPAPSFSSDPVVLSIRDLLEDEYCRRVTDRARLLLFDVCRSRGRLSGSQQAGCDGSRSSAGAFAGAGRSHCEFVGSHNVSINQLILVQVSPNGIICQACSTTETFESHVDRAAGYARDGEIDDKSVKSD